MRIHFYFALPGMFGLLSACSSANDHGTQSSSISSGNDSVSINTTTGGSASTGSGTHWTAEQTTDGLLRITAGQAESIIADPATACTGWAEEPEAAASVVEFMIDVSGSMTKVTAATGTQSKWTVTQNAIHAAIDALPSSLAVGLTFFPNMKLNALYTARPSSACVNVADDVAIAPLSDTQRALLTSTVDRIRANPDGATPTNDAYSVALANLRASTAPGQKYLVVITDGQPTQSLGCIGSGMTCTPEPTQPVIDAIAAARKNDSVKTFVVGSPGSEKNDCTNADVRDWLSAAARAGDTDTVGCSDQGPSYCHYDISLAANFGTALAGALSSISKSVISCDYLVPPPNANQTIDTGLINMIYNDGAGAYSLVLEGSEATCEKGWQFADATQSKIHVCDTTCKILQSNPQATITLVFGCTQDQLQPTIL
jgi:hypothetical protein